MPEKTPADQHAGIPQYNTENWLYEVFKGDGEQVLYCEHLQTVKYRNPGDFRDQIEKQ